MPTFPAPMTVQHKRGKLESSAWPRSRPANLWGTSGVGWGLSRGCEKVPTDLMAGVKWSTVVLSSSFCCAGDRCPLSRDCTRAPLWAELSEPGQVGSKGKSAFLAQSVRGSRV